jgi:beta-alanine degradation protein BauB
MLNVLCSEGRDDVRGHLATAKAGRSLAGGHRGGGVMPRERSCGCRHPSHRHPGDKIMKAVPQVQVDNPRVIVTLWTFAPGAETGDHVHAHDYVVVPLTTGTLRLVEPTGVRDVPLQAGASYAREAGVAHNVINANDFEYRFVEIEMK